MDVTFTDRLPADEPDPSDTGHHASPRRMRQFRQGHLVPDGRLDLHGLHRDQALEKVRWYLQDAAWQGLRTILIITGRGKNSPEGPVLREAVARYLNAGGDGLVLEWGLAPQRFGGEGALVVFLRSSPKT
jgi:DNA-nicking Smr family endonuclease